MKKSFALSSLVACALLSCASAHAAFTYGTTTSADNATTGAEIAARTVLTRVVGTANAPAPLAVSDDSPSLTVTASKAQQTLAKWSINTMSANHLYKASNLQIDGTSNSSAVMVFSKGTPTYSSNVDALKVGSDSGTGWALYVGTNGTGVGAGTHTVSVTLTDYSA